MKKGKKEKTKIKRGRKKEKKGNIKRGKKEKDR